MALVMLPCELPWWPQLQRLLRQLEDGAANSVESLVRVLTSVHALCNVGLDPDEPETVDLEQFAGLSAFLLQCEEAERQQVLSVAVPCMVRHALRLRELKPPAGLHFSLQQQADSVALDKRLAAALLAHAFFSSFPKRSFKTHPTLADFNFSHFFKHLHLPSQQAKLRSLMQYFCLLHKSEPPGSLKISRRVLSSARWFTVEDWLESARPLCPVLVRHQPRPERAPEPGALLLAPCLPHVGHGVLADDFSPQSRLLAAQPEALAVLLFVEALEDNEALLLEGASRAAKLSSVPPHFEPASASTWCSTSAQLLSFADPEDFAALPARQYEEDNVLRELNKLFLSFEPAAQAGAGAKQPAAPQAGSAPSYRRLSPIGESFSSTPPEGPNGGPSSVAVTASAKKCLLRICSADRAGRFIALGSSGELLPISRFDLPAGHSTRLSGPRHSLIGGLQQEQAAVVPASPPVQQEPLVVVSPASQPPAQQRRSGASSRRGVSSELGDSSDEDEFHSAKESLDLSEAEGVEVAGAAGRGHELDTPQRRCSFAQRLREALRREASAIGSCSGGTKDNLNTLSSSSSSSEPEGSSYNPAASSLASSDLADHKFKVRAGGSCGFALPEDQDLGRRASRDPLGLAQARWLGRALSKDTDSLDDSCASQHNSEYSSDLEELYEHFSRWLENDRAGGEEVQEEAVRSFARGLLTRTLSDCGALTGPARQQGTVARSLSEAAGCSSHSRGTAPRRLAAHLASLLGDGRSGPRPVVAGSWWGGALQSTDPQLKALLQWLAASQAQASCLLYYTASVSPLNKFDTLCRVIVDRQWSVGELTGAVLRFAQTSLELEDSSLPSPAPKRALFDELLGTERVAPETEL